MCLGMLLIQESPAGVAEEAATGVWLTARGCPHGERNCKDKREPSAKHKRREYVTQHMLTQMH